MNFSQKSTYHKLLECAFVLSLIAIVHSCNTKRIQQENISFYYWKTNYKLSSTEVDYLKQHQVKKIYLHCFDVVSANNTPIPQGVLIWNDTVQNNIQYIPTVFIENKIFLQGDTSATQLLADKIISLSKQILSAKKIPLSEIQIDCDWTKSTRDTYFFFLRCLKQKGLIVSNTLRLYQYKYRSESGIAPTDYVSLMCYNMGNMKNEHAENSILNKKDLQSYINGQSEYPKPLNIALPIFNWTLLYHQHSFKGILYKNPDLQNGKWSAMSGTQYTCIHDYYDLNCAQEFYNDDIIRIEQISKKELQEAVAILKKQIKNSKNEIIYFDLDSSKIHHSLY